MKFIRLFFIAGTLHQGNAANADFNENNSAIINETDDDEDDEEDDMDEIDIDQEAEEDIIETEDAGIADEDADLDDIDLDDEDDDEVVSEKKEKSGLQESLQQWSNDNARDIAEDDSTPLRSNL